MNAARDLDPIELLELFQRDPDAAREALRAAVAERASADPRLSALMAMIAQSQEQPTSEEGGRSGGMEQIRERMIEMREELEELHARNEHLARALGACPACWGRVQRCDRCHGRGKAGWLLPDPVLFKEFVAPALARRQSSPEEEKAPPTESNKGEDQ